MATNRLYISNADSAFAPTTFNGTWSKTSDADTGQILGPKSGTAVANTTTKTVATNPYNGLIYQAVSAPLTVPTTFTASDTIQWVWGTVENTTNANAFQRIHVYVTQGNSNTSRGVLLSNFTSAIESTTTATGKGDGTQPMAGTVNAQIGDRIIVELGVQFQNTITTATSGLNYGGTGGTDLTNGSTSVTTQPGWVEFVTSVNPFGHNAIGVLVGPGAIVAGTAAHMARHTSTGALVGPGAVVTGSAARIRAHASSGILVGPGSTITGDAARASGFITHPSSGVLVGPGSIVVGTANHTTAPKTHIATGVLVGPGSIINGHASGPGITVTGGHFVPLTRKQQQAYQKRLRRERREREADITERRLSDEAITQDIRNAISPKTERLSSEPTINDTVDGVEDSDSEDIEFLLLYG